MYKWSGFLEKRVADFIVFRVALEESLIFIWCACYYAGALNLAVQAKTW